MCVGRGCTVSLVCSTTATYISYLPQNSNGLGFYQQHPPVEEKRKQHTKLKVNILNDNDVFLSTLMFKHKA